MKCNDCIHFPACTYYDIELTRVKELNRYCHNFLSKDRVIILPIKVNESLKIELCNHCYVRCIEEL